VDVIFVGSFEKVTVLEILNEDTAESY